MTTLTSPQLHRNTSEADFPGSIGCVVLNAFEASSEFATVVSTLYGTAGGENERTESFVRNLYLAATGAEPTSQQLQDGRNAIDNAANGSAGVSPAVAVQAAAEIFGRNLFSSQVTSTTISTTTFVTNLYEGFLQRGPDAGGLNWWIGQAGGEGNFNSSARQNVLNAFATCDAFKQLSGTLYREVYWLIPDHLGTPRILADRTGTLAGIRRHDYMPYGEEIGGTVGSRTTAQGYTSTDTTRQKFVGYEREGETGLDFAKARYFSGIQGRFTTVDPLLASGRRSSPKTWNRYSYVLNNPLRLVDRYGLFPQRTGLDSGGCLAPDEFVEQEQDLVRIMVQKALTKNLTRFLGPAGIVTVIQVIVEAGLEIVFGENLEVIRGGLNTEEFSQASEVSEFSGNSILGMPKGNPGYDGIMTKPGELANVRGLVSLTATQHGNPNVVNDLIRDKEDSASKAGAKNVDLYIKATGLDSQTVIGFLGRNPGDSQSALGRGTLRSINVFTNDGKVVRVVKGGTTICDRKGKCQ